MATDVKVQGKTIRDCLQSLRIYSEKYGVTYKATFGFDAKEHIVKPQTILEKPNPIYMSFMWRHQYMEYDNSC